MNIRDLGFSEEDYLKFQQIIKRPNGIFLVTGPTGTSEHHNNVVCGFE